MSLERFGKLLIELSELSRDERSIIFIQLAKDFGFCIGPKDPAAAAKSLPVAGKPQNHGKPIDDYERHEFMRFAAVCQRMPLRKRSRIYNEASRAMGRSYDSVRCEVLKAIKELKKSTAIQKERWQ